MTASPPRPTGFVLVGVVMFVLVLTILGLSLYGLSSYESQFLWRSHDQTLALYRAQGGMEMVKALLRTRWRLDDAALAIGSEDVVAVDVRQPKLGGGFATAGDMSDSTVYVTVTTQSGASGARRTLTAHFLPTPTDDYYKRLFTIVDGIECGAQEPPPKGTGRVVISPGEDVWQGSDDSTWVQQASFGPPRLITVKTTTPAPPVSAFVAAHSAGATTPNFFHMPGLLVFMNAGTQAKYFGPVPSLTTPYYDFNNDGPSLSYVAVRGECVWVVPAGVRFENQVEISSWGGGNATLVIVAGPNGRDGRWGNYRDVGIWFFGGLKLDPNVNLVLVSDGRVIIDSYNGAIANSWATNLSVYARDLALIGPKDPHTTTLAHSSLVDAAIDDLLSQGALPNPAGPMSAFAFVRGSWQDLTP